MAAREFDVVVVGAGVIGHSIAFKLRKAEPGLRIAVLGDPMNSLMASRAAAGMLAPFGECDRNDRFFRFCRESLDKFPDFARDVAETSGTEIYLSMSGSIMPRNLVADHWDARLEFFRKAGVPHEVWSVAEVREKLPHVSEHCGEAIWVGEGQVNNRQLHDALVAAAARMGIELINQNATGFACSPAGIAETVTDAGRVRGKKVVLACGSWSAQLGKVLGVSLPMRPIKGQMCRMQVEDNRLDYTVHGFLTYIAPWRGGHGFVLGSTMEERGFDPAIEESAIQGLIDRASEVLPCLRQARLIESWTGLRPAAEDLMPVMGRSGRHENLYYSTGHYRNGILQAPNQADYLAGIILGGRGEDIPEFSPCRYNL
jgi:glycine oxidase